MANLIDRDLLQRMIAEKMVKVEKHHDYFSRALKRIEELKRILTFEFPELHDY